MNKNATENRGQERDFTIEVGQCFRKGPTVFRISADFGSYLRLEHVESLEAKHIRTSELAGAYSRGELIPCTKEDAARALSGDNFEEDDSSPVVKDATFMFGEKASKQGLRIIKYITRLRALGYECLRPQPLLELEVERIARNIGDENPPKISTIYSSSLAIAQRGGDLRAAIPRYRDRGGRGKLRIAPEAASALARSTERLSHRPKEQVVFRAIERDVFHQLLVQHGQEKAMTMMPSSSAITSFVKSEISEYEIYARKHGRTAANRKYRSWYPRERATFPLEVVEFDDKDTRVFGIDQRTGLPCGRIHLTSGVDQYSAAPLGFSISSKPRNTWSAINALSNSVLPKDVKAPDWEEVKSDVPYMGTMGLIVFDNALYNHAKALEECALDITNATISWAKPYTPTEKSIIEDFNGRVSSDFLIDLPGFGGPKVSRDMLDNGVIAANLTVQEFIKLFNCWTYDVYANTPRAGGMTPRQKWEKGMLNRRSRLPADINRVRIATMLRHELRLRPEGILFIGLIYNNQRLQLLRKRIGHSALIEFRYDPERLADVFVFDSEACEWFQVSNVNLDYVKYLTLYQHKLIRKMAISDGKQNPAIPLMLEYRERLMTLVNQAKYSKKLKERKWAARVGDTPSSSAGAPPETTVMVTDLEAQVMDIDCVEMDVADEGWEFPTL